MVLKKGRSSVWQDYCYPSTWTRMTLQHIYLGIPALLYIYIDIPIYYSDIIYTNPDFRHWTANQTKILSVFIQFSNRNIGRLVRFEYFCNFISGYILESNLEFSSDLKSNSLSLVIIYNYIVCRLVPIGIYTIYIV